MQILSNVGDYVIFKEQTPFLNVIKVRDFYLEASGENISKEFRWSTDNKIYSAWTELTMQNLRNISLDPKSEFWIETKFTLLESPEVEIISYSLDLEFSNQKNTINKPINFCSENGNLLSTIDLKNICFDPYNVNPAACLYQELSYAVNMLFGHEVEYFKCDADISSKDITFNEYSIYSVKTQKCIKVLVENNEFPDAQLQHNPFGIDFEMPFEIHIDKTYWEEVFGNGTAPQKRDVLYFKLNNRIYEVLSSYLFKAFMERDSYWKVSLIKYQPKANRYESPEIRQTLDLLTTDSSKLFEKEYREQEEKISKPAQYSKFKGDSKYDPSRSNLHEGIQIIESNIENYSTIISEYQYKLTDLVDFSKSSQHEAIVYRELANISEESEFAYSSWFSIDKFNVFLPEDKVENMSLDTNTNQLLITLNKNRNYKIGDYIKFTRSPDLVFYGMIIGITDPSTYNLQLEENVVKYMDSYNSMWTGLSNYSAKKIIPNNFLSGYQNGKGISIDIFANRYFCIILNQRKYIIPLNKSILEGEFLGLFINISNKFKQISLYLWERKWVSGVLSSPQTTDLYNRFSVTLNNIESENIQSNTNYNIKASNIILTNIRVYDQTLEIEKQAKLLNQNIVQDEQRTVIIDNAFPNSKLAFIAQTK